MAKTKTFITVIPFQGNNGLKATVYKSDGNSKLEYGETRFPIIPAINGYTEKGDKIRVIAILIDGDNYKHNFETYFVPEIESLVKAKELSFDGIEIIRKPEKEDIETQLTLFRNIIDKIEDDEEIFACLTYGRKIEPIVETMALNYAYKIKKNVSIGCVVYGLFMHTESGSDNYIYDVTSLFFTSTIIDKIAEMNVKEPEKAIRAMLGTGDKNE